MSISLEDFFKAQQRISAYLKPTTLLKSNELQQFLGYQGSIYLKLESEQPTGSFKVRGAFNALLQLKPNTQNVVTFSSGNFAQAVAFGASKVGVKATIVMPSRAPRTKIEGTKRLGAEIVFAGDSYEEGDLIVKDLVEKNGYSPLHPFDDYHTIVGQGTIALEVLKTNPSVAHFFSPVGGGGLLSGCALALKSTNPDIVTYAVEPLGANDFFQSFNAKKHIALQKVDTIADGLRASSVGKRNYPILMQHVDRALAISDAQIIEAMRLVWNQHHIAIEPSAAVALAGFLSVYRELKGDVVILITGKNVDQDMFKKWMES
jgi:threonine dehydratase